MECIFCNKKFLNKESIIIHLRNKSCKSELFNDWVSLYNFYN